MSDALERDAERPRSDVSEDDFHHLFWAVSRPVVAMILSDAALEVISDDQWHVDVAYYFTSVVGVWMLSWLGMVGFSLQVY